MRHTSALFCILLVASVLSLIAGSTGLFVLIGLGVVTFVVFLVDWIKHHPRPLRQKSPQDVPTQLAATDWLSEPLEKARKKKEVQRCINCKAEIVIFTNFCLSCGQSLEINVTETLRFSLSIMERNPLIFLPIFLLQLPFTLLNLFKPTTPLEGPEMLQWLMWSVLFAIPMSVVVSPIIYGMYPSMVKNVVDGREVRLGESFRKAVRRFPSMFGSGLLVMLKIIIGTILLIIPGVYYALCYYCTYPAVILEERGARDGMSASKLFSQNRKWKMLVLLAIAWSPAFIPAVALRFVRGTFLYNLASSGVNLIFGSLSGVLLTVMSSYIYIRYGMARPSKSRST